MESDSPVSAAAAAGCDEAAPEDVCAAEDDCSPEPAGSVMVIFASYSFAADDAPDDAADCAAEEDVPDGADDDAPSEAPHAPKPIATADANSIAINRFINISFICVV